MSILGKVFAGLNIVAAIAFAVLAIMALDKHNDWRQLAKQKEAALETKLDDNKQIRWGLLQAGKLTREGILQAQTQLHDILVDRGRVWYDAAPGAVDDNGGTSVDIRMTNSKNEPVPHQLQPGGIVYIFDKAAKADGGQYLGEFKVAGLDGETKIALAPLRPLTPEELARLRASQAKASADWTWTLYEVMPRDRHDIFAKLAEDELRALLPAETVEDYLKDGKPAEGTDPDDQKDEKGNYIRALRDYVVVFREYDRQKNVLLDRIASTQDDLNAMLEAQKGADQHEAAEKALIEKLKGELAELTRERDSVIAHRSKLEEGLAGSREAIERLFDENKQMAAELERIQVEQARQIDAAVADGQ